MATLDDLIAKISRIKSSVPSHAPSRSMKLPDPTEDVVMAGGVRYPLAPVDYSNITETTGPSVSYGDLIESAYSRAPGGKDAAINMSLEAQDRSTNALGFESVDYGGFTPLDAVAPRPVRVLPAGEPDSTIGMLQARSKRPDGALLLKDEIIGDGSYDDPFDSVLRDAVLKHEAVHGLTIDRPRQRNASNFAINYGDPSLKAMGAGLLQRLLPERVSRSKRYANYISRIAEVDARLPEIRQLFAYNTGRHVRNLEDADSAWNWYRRRGAPGLNMDFRDFRFYDALDPDLRKVLLLRMTHLPSVLAGLTAAGYAMPEQEGGEPGVQSF